MDGMICLTREIEGCFRNVKVRSEASYARMKTKRQLKTEVIDEDLDDSTFEVGSSSSESSSGMDSVTDVIVDDEVSPSTPPETNSHLSIPSGNLIDLEDGKFIVI